MINDGYPPDVNPHDPRAPWNRPESIPCANEDCDNDVETEGDYCDDCC